MRGNVADDAGAGVSDQHGLPEAWSLPAEWHRRGLRHPDEIEALVHERTRGSVPPEPTYGDFFRTE